MSTETEIKEETIEQRFQRERGEWTAKITGHATSLKNIKNFTDVQVGVYSDRQILVEYIHNLIASTFKLNSLLLEARAKAIKKLSEDSDFRFEKTDKKDLIEWEVDALKTRKEVITTHIGFLNESTKTIDNIIWGLKDRIKFEELKRDI